MYAPAGSSLNSALTPGARGRPPVGLTREAQRALLEYHWPGNVRELRNVLERAAILSEDGLIEPSHLSLQSGTPSPRHDATDLHAIERTTIVKVLHEARGNKTKAARRLGLSRTQLHSRIRKYGLEEAAVAGRRGPTKGEPRIQRAMAGNARRHRWHSWQPWPSAI